MKIIIVFIGMEGIVFYMRFLINGTGMCEECILVELNECELIKKRKKALNKFEILDKEK